VTVVYILLRHFPSRLRFVPPPRENKDIILYIAEEMAAISERV
jgi:hypothetical protein